MLETAQNHSNKSTALKILHRAACILAMLLAIYNLFESIWRFFDALEDLELPIRVAVMGCAVNGPGEAREADIGVAGGDGCGLIFRKGEILRKVPESEIISALLDEIEKM